MWLWMNDERSQAVSERSEELEFLEVENFVSSR